MNELETFESYSLAGLEYLTWLDLSDNKLTEIKEDTFANTSRLIDFKTRLENFSFKSLKVYGIALFLQQFISKDSI
jgi:hypothetical protein